MNYSLKGALLAGLVFPGLGQVVLKHYKRGIAWMLAVVAGLLVVVSEATEQALTILEKVESQGGAIDMKTISNAATQASTTSDSIVFNGALFLIIICWIGAVVDAYRIGRTKDLRQQSADQVLSGKSP